MEIELYRDIIVISKSEKFREDWTNCMKLESGNQISSHTHTHTHTRARARLTYMHKKDMYNFWKKSQDKHNSKGDEESTILERSVVRTPLKYIAWQV